MFNKINFFAGFSCFLCIAAGAVEAAQREINFNQFDTVAYSNQDQGGTLLIEDNGSTLVLTGNRVRALPFTYEVTPRTRIAFDFTSNREGEVHAIGLDNDLWVDWDRTIQLYGTQRFGVQTHNDYSAGAGKKHYDIPVGQYYRGAMKYLFLVMDHDVAAPDGQSRFSNIVIYEEGQMLQPESNDSTEQETEVVKEAPVNVIDFNITGTIPYAGQDSEGSVDILDRGNSIKLVGNRVRAVPVDYRVTENTRLKFQFNSDARGEVHGIGVDTDLWLAGSRIFQLFGTQHYGIQDFHNYQSGDKRSYDIPLGQYFSGDMRYLLLVMDNDIPSPQSDSTFSAVTIYEQGQEPPVGVDPVDVDAVDTADTAPPKNDAPVEPSPAAPEPATPAPSPSEPIVSEPVASDPVSEPVIPEIVAPEPLPDTAPQAEPAPQPEQAPQPKPEPQPEPQDTDQKNNVHLEWNIPTTREDGSPLSAAEIDSYVIYYASSALPGGSVTITVAARDAAGDLVSSYMIHALGNGDYFFSMATVDTDGKVSQFSQSVNLQVR